MRSPRLSECLERQDKDELDLVYDEMKKHKKVRRSYKKKNREQNITIMYSNIQGFTKKCNSLLYIMDELDCDICLLAETMTRKVKIDGCRCIIPRKSIGQNVCIIIRKNYTDKVTAFFPCWRRSLKTVLIIGQTFKLLSLSYKR